MPPPRGSRRASAAPANGPERAPRARAPRTPNSAPRDGALCDPRSPAPTAPAEAIPLPRNARPKPLRNRSPPRAPARACATSPGAAPPCAPASRALRSASAPRCRPSRDPPHRPGSRAAASRRPRAAHGRSPRYRNSEPGPPSPARSNTRARSGCAPAGPGNTTRSGARCGEAPWDPRSATARRRPASCWRSRHGCGAADRGCGWPRGGTSPPP